MTEEDTIGALNWKRIKSCSAFDAYQGLQCEGVPHLFSDHKNKTAAVYDTVVYGLPHLILV